MFKRKNQRKKNQRYQGHQRSKASSSHRSEESSRWGKKSDHRVRPQKTYLKKDSSSSSSFLSEKRFREDRPEYITRQSQFERLEREDRRPRSSSFNKSSFNKSYKDKVGNRGWDKDRNKSRNRGYEPDKLYKGKIESKGWDKDRNKNKNKNRVHEPIVEEKRYLIFGIRPLEEAMQREISFHRLYLQKDEDRFEEMIRYCKERKINFFFAEKTELDERSGGQNHQGVIAELKRDTRLIPDLREYLKKYPLKDATTGSGEVILILDQITDQQNVGAIARSAYFFGCRLIICEKSHSAPIDAVVHKTSSGASLMVAFHIADKLTEAIEILRESGCKILSATSEDAIPLSALKGGDEPCNYALIMGSEGKGIRPHLEKVADRRIHIPGLNSFDSLNVSVATGIILYEMSEGRLIGG